MKVLLARRVVYIVMSVLAVSILGIGIFLGNNTVTNGSEGTATLLDSFDFVSASSATQMYKIVSDESEVRFLIDEVLAGRDTTAVGKTNKIEGEARFDFGVPLKFEIGTIRINLRDLQTDNSMRNRMINGRILQSRRDEYQFSEFNPKSIDGLPESLKIGEPIEFQITGDFTLRGITNSVTFDVKLTLVSETRIEGSANAVVKRSDYQLRIPSVPRVAGVSDEVRLEIDFVAEEFVEEEA